MVARLFGTDGIRGVANVDLKPTLAYALGRATAHHLAEPGGAIVVGQDTRRSGDMFVSAIAAGASSVGVDVQVVGVVPTPALAFLARTGPFAGGIMVSASHNPADDNGLKVLDRDGPEARRRGRGPPGAAHLAGRGAAGRHQRGPRPGHRRRADLVEAYVEHRLGLATSIDAAGLRIVLDGANGSGCLLGPRILAATGAAVEVIHAEPDGVNINVRSGATDPASLAEAVVARGADVGFALDGDADRLIAVDAAGRIVDGDQVLGILALDRLARGALPGGGLVVSVLSNGGLQDAIEAAGGQVLRTPVGDKYILEGMQLSGAVLGGEKSGHVIVLEHTTSGDGIVTALEVLRVMARERRALADLAARIPLLPQQQRAVKARQRDLWESDRRVHERRGGRPGPAGTTRPHPRPSLGNGACAPDHGRGARRKGGDRSRRRARGHREGAARLAAVPTHLGHHCLPARDRRRRMEDQSTCAASSATRARATRDRSSSKASNASSTAATTRRGSPWSTTRATSSWTSGRASSSTSRRPSRTGPPTRRSASRTPAGRRTAGPTTSTPIPTRTARARSRSSTTGSSRTSASCATASRPAATA